MLYANADMNSTYETDEFTKQWGYADYKRNGSSLSSRVDKFLQY